MLLDDGSTTSSAGSPGLESIESLGVGDPAACSRLERLAEGALSSGLASWSDLFGRTLELSRPEVGALPPQGANGYGTAPGAILVEIPFLQGARGVGWFVLDELDARELVSLVLGTPEPVESLDAIHRASLTSAVRFALAKVRSGLTQVLGRRVGTGDPTVRAPSEVSGGRSQSVLCVRWTWTASGASPRRIEFWADRDLARSLAALPPTSSILAAPGADSFERPTRRAAEIPVAARPSPATGPGGPRIQLRNVEAASRPPPEQPVRRAPVAPEVVPAASRSARSHEADLHVMMGQTRLAGDLSVGQVVALDRMAGDLVDVWYDGRLTARGEVTVLDDRIAVAITELVR